GPTPLQLGSGGDAPASVYDAFSVLGSGATSARPVLLPSTMPPKPSPAAKDRFRVTCHVGSSVPANRMPARPPAADADAYSNDASSDQAASNRSPTRRNGPSKRPRGAPPSPTSWP